jgi:hypothetical protein
VQALLDAGGETLQAPRDVGRAAGVARRPQPRGGVVGAADDVGVEEG